jgi:hypothetical protein
MDATSLYCPSLVPVRSAYSAHNSENGSVTTLDAAEEEVNCYSFLLVHYSIFLIRSSSVLNIKLIFL